MKCIYENLVALVISNRAKTIKLFFSFSDQSLVVGGTFLVNIFLARILSYEDYGTFAITYTIFTFFSGFHNALIIEPYTVFSTGNYRNNTFEYFQFALKMNMLACIFFTTFLLFIIFLASWFGLNVLSIYQSLAVSLLFTLTGIFLRRVFYIRGDEAYAAIASLVSLLMMCLGFFYLNSYNLISGSSVFLLFGFSSIFTICIFFNKYGIPIKKVNFLKSYPNYLVEHYDYSKWVIATAFVFQLLNQGYIWIVGFLMSLDDVAKLKAVMNLAQPINLVFASISMLLLPKLSAFFQKESIDNFDSVVKRATFLLVILTFVLLLPVFLFGEQIIDFVYNQKYPDTLPLLYTLSASSLVFSLGIVLNDALKVMGQPRWVFYSYCAGGTITVLAGSPLIVNYGLIGAAIAALISSVCFSGVLIFGYCKTTSILRANA